MGVVLIQDHMTARPLTYIGETTRNLTVYVQLTEHNQVTRNTVF